MERELIAKQIGGEVVATVRVTADGTLDVRPAREQWALAVGELIHRLAEQGLPRLESSHSSDSVERTRSSAVSAGDPGFLEALADAVTKSGTLVGGCQIRAWVESFEQR